MLNGPSEHPVQLEPPKKSSIHFVVPESIKCLTPANIIERLLAKHGILVAKYPWVYIVGCLVLTIGQAHDMFSRIFGIPIYEFSSGSAHQTPNSTNPKFQFPQFKVLQSVSYFFV